MREYVRRCVLYVLCCMRIAGRVMIGEGFSVRYFHRAHIWSPHIWAVRVRAHRIVCAFKPTLTAGTVPWYCALVRFCVYTAARARVLYWVLDSASRQSSICLASAQCVCVLVLWSIVSECAPISMSDQYDDQSGQKPVR